MGKMTHNINYLQLHIEHRTTEGADKAQVQLRNRRDQTSPLQEVCRNTASFISKIHHGLSIKNLSYEFLFVLDFAKMHITLKNEWFSGWKTSFSAVYRMPALGLPGWWGKIFLSFCLGSSITKNSNLN